MQLLLPLAEIGVESVLMNMAEAAAWALFATLLLAGLMWLFDLITPGRLHDMLFREKSQSAATVYAGVIIALAIIIAAAIHG